MSRRSSSPTNTIACSIRSVDRMLIPPCEVGTVAARRACGGVPCTHLRTLSPFPSPCTFVLRTSTDPRQPHVSRRPLLTLTCTARPVPSQRGAYIAPSIPSFFSIPMPPLRRHRFPSVLFDTTTSATTTASDVVARAKGGWKAHVRRWLTCEEVRDPPAATRGGNQGRS